MRLHARFAAALALLAGASGPGRALADAPCLEDAARVCPGIPVGDARLWPCLQRNSFQLSAQCTKNLQEVQRRASEFSADCLADAQRFCTYTKPGEGRILECLYAYVGRRELSTSCEDAVVTAAEKLQTFADACADDAARLCAGVQPGKGRLLLCLRAQSSHLSSRCGAAVNP
jgi:hypothetical protein